MSKLDQVKMRPATHVFTSRADGRYLATLLLFWRSQESPPSSISELIRLSVETFTEFLTTNNMVKFVDSYEDAENILQSTGFGIKRMNARNVAEVLAKESVSLDFLKSTSPESLVRKSDSVSVPDLATAQALLQKAMDDGLQEQIASAKEGTDAFLNSMGDTASVRVVEDGKDED